MPEKRAPTALEIRKVLPWRARHYGNCVLRSLATFAIQAWDRMKNFRDDPAVMSSTLQQSLVSILIPTLSRDGQAGRLQTLEALLARYLPAQTHERYEAIVYCDGRNDAVERMVAAIGDARVRVRWTRGPCGGRWGHPQTRLGIDEARGDYFVRVNDDDRPYPEYLRVLLQGFSPDAGISYARVVFKGEARKSYSYLLRGSYVVPRDRAGTLENGNVDCLCYMVRMDLARRYRDHWGDMYAADWRFLEAMLDDGVKASFTNRLIADKH